MNPSQGDGGRRVATLPLPNFPRGAKRKKRVRPERVETPPDKVPRINPDFLRAGEARERADSSQSTFDTINVEQREDAERQRMVDHLSGQEADDDIDTDLLWEGGGLEEDEP